MFSIKFEFRNIFKENKMGVNPTETVLSGKTNEPSSSENGLTCFSANLTLPPNLLDKDIKIEKFFS